MSNHCQNNEGSRFVKVYMFFFYFFSDIMTNGVTESVYTDSNLLNKGGYINN